MSNTFLLNANEAGGQIVEKRDGVWRVELSVTHWEADWLDRDIVLELYELDSGHPMDAYSGTTGEERDDLLGSIRCRISRAGEGYSCQLLPVEGVTPATFLQAPSGDSAEAETGDEFQLAFPQAGEGSEPVHVPIRGESRSANSTGEQWAFEVDFTFKTPAAVTIGETSWGAGAAIAPVRTSADGPRAWVRLLEAAATDAAAFKRAVLERQIANAIARGRQHYDAVPESELAVVEGRYRLRPEAAQSCRQLLQQARAEKPSTVTRIAIGSAYRNPHDDAANWDRNYRNYYNATRAARGRLEGGEHGEAAVDYLATYIGGRKAAPGYSNHSDGRAVDFLTTEDGVAHTIDTSAASRSGWRNTWLHRWLREHASEFGFSPLATEEWHWNHG